MSRPDPPRKAHDPGAGIVASLLLTGSSMAKAAMVRNIGGAAASGYRPSLFGLLFNARSFAGAPAPVKAAALVTLGAGTLVSKVGGLPSPTDVSQYMQTKVEDIWAASKSE